MCKLASRLAVVCLFVAALCPFAAAQQLDELPLDRWAKLRETERYQLQIAEKYYREQNWKVALSEYEKYLSLYEKSEAGAYTQMKWAICQVRLRKSNTAIKDGFQSVIDYWPESSEAIAARYYMGNTYKGMGQLPQARKVYAELIAKHPEHLATVYAMVDQIDIATLDNDPKTRVELWRKLTHDIKRTNLTAGHCQNASRSLAAYCFETGAFDDGVKALATTYTEPQLPGEVVAYSRDPIQRLTGTSDTKTKGEKVADQVISWLRGKMPADLATDDGKKAARQIGFYIADVYGYSRRDEKIPEVYNDLVKQTGADDTTLGRLAAWQKSKGRFEEARTTYLRFDNKFEGQGQRAYSFREERKFDQAVEAYRQLMLQDGEHSARWLAEIAATYRSIPKWPETITSYQQLEKEDVKNADNWRWHTALAYRDSGQYKEAIHVLRQCVNFPENFKQIAYCHRQLKQFDEASSMYAQVAASHEPSAPWALLQVAYSREEAGQKEAAIKMFQTVCKKFPKDSHASVAHAHLQDKYKISVTLGGAKDE